MGLFILILFVIAANSLFAATPKDTLVMAPKLDDILTLDPAEVFEFTGAELTSQHLRPFDQL